MIVAILIVVGLALGSFVNALIWRIHEQAELSHKLEKGKKLTKAEKERSKRLSIVKGHSMCLRCGHQLAVKDLVPVISWLSLRGRCRYCSARIPDTPLAELLVPLVFVISYLWWPLVLQGSIAILVFLGWLAAMVIFVALTLYDFRWFILPDRMVFPLVGISALTLVLEASLLPQSWQALSGGLWGILVIAGLFYGLFVLSDGRWIGGGDVKLGVALGLLVGGPVKGLLVIFLASVFGLLSALPDIVRGKAGGSTKLPFGPFLLLGTFIAFLFGDSLVNWYLSWFGM
jgi:leader peptidase (prepilin peptidase)/N-methyltransferase